MRRLKFLVLAAFYFFSLLGMSQDCKYPKKMRKLAQKHLKKEKIVKATKFYPLFKNFSMVGSTNFVKSEKGYYLGLVFLRDFAAMIDINTENPLVFKFANDSLVTIYPDRSIPGKFSLPVTSQINKAYYHVSSEQLKMFASHRVNQVNIYFTKKKERNSSEEQKYTDGLDFDTANKKKLQARFMEAANCIFQ